MASFARNAWPRSVGISGRFASEYATITGLEGESTVDAPTGTLKCDACGIAIDFKGAKVTLGDCKYTVELAHLRSTQMNPAAKPNKLSSQVLQKQSINKAQIYLKSTSFLT